MTPIHRSLALALVLAAPLSAQPSGAPYTVEETGRGYARLQDAVTAIGSGDGTIRIAPGTYRRLEAPRRTLRRRLPTAAIR